MAAATQALTEGACPAAKAVSAAFAVSGSTVTVSRVRNTMRFDDTRHDEYCTSVWTELIAPPWRVS